MYPERNAHRDAAVVFPNPAPPISDLVRKRRTLMESIITEKTKQCCAREYEGLKNQLEICNRRSRTAAERHRCYRIAARSSGRRSKRCAVGE
jgi:hypothetical protein